MAEIRRSFTPQLYYHDFSGTESRVTQNPGSHHKGATGRVRTGDELSTNGIQFYVIGSLDKTPLTIVWCNPWLFPSLWNKGTRKVTISPAVSIRSTGEPETRTSESIGSQSRWS